MIVSDGLHCDGDGGERIFQWCVVWELGVGIHSGVDDDELWTGN